MTPLGLGSVESAPRQEPSGHAPLRIRSLPERPLPSFYKNGEWAHSDGGSESTPPDPPANCGNCWGTCGRDHSFDVHPRKIVKGLDLTKTQKRLLISGPLRTMALWGNRAKRNSRWYYGLTIVTNFQHVASPVLFAVLQHADVQADPTIERYVYWVAQATSVIATLCFALLSIFLFKDKHELYSDMRDELDSEVQQYLSLSGAYLGLSHRSAFPVFEEVYIHVKKTLKSKLSEARAKSKPPAGQGENRGNADVPNEPVPDHRDVADQARRRASVMEGLEPAFSAAGELGRLGKVGFQLPEAAEEIATIATNAEAGLRAGSIAGGRQSMPYASSADQKASALGSAAISSASEMASAVASRGGALQVGDVRLEMGGTVSRL